MKQNICSYCKEIGHYINTCNNENINILHNTLLKDAVIDLYCLYKFDFNFLLYKLNLLSIPQLRVLGYINNYKLSNNPNKTQIQEYIYYLINIYSYQNKTLINIPYINNDTLWNYASTINRLIDNNTVLSIYSDIIKISPRPRCYDNTKISLSCKKNDSFNDIDHNCSICLNNISEPKSCVLNCNHEFCSICIKKFLNSLYMKFNDNDEFCQPECPLCRTIISNIILKDDDIHTYFLETFYNKFTPDYFNSISTNNITFEHNYEKPFYHQNLLDYESDSDMMSPYNLPLPTNMLLVHYIHNINMNVVNNINYFLIGRWFFFIGSIYLIHYIQNFIYEKYYDFDEYL